MSQNLTYPRFKAFYPSTHAFAGQPLAGGFVNTYLAGTDTPTDTFTNYTLAVSNGVQVELDANGEADIYLSRRVKVKLLDPDGNQIWEKDNQTGEGSSLVDMTLLSEYVSFSAAITAIGDTKTTLWIDEDVSMTANVTVKTTTELRRLNGAIIDLANHTLVLQTTGIKADEQQLFAFTGGGTITIADGTVLKSSWFPDFATAISKIGTSKVRLQINGSCSVTTSPTLSANTILEFPTPSDMFSIATGQTVTIYNPENIIAGTYQIITGVGTVVFSIPGTCWADWWGRSNGATALLSAYNAISDGSTIKMSGGVWQFGNTEVDIIESLKTVHIEGSGYDNDEGTNIIYTGTGGALKINGYSTLEKVRISGGGAYGLILGNQGGSPVAFIGAIRDVRVSGASIAGIYAQGIQVGYLENVFSEGNTGSGMLVGNGGNTHGVFIKCRFYNNGAEGILYTTNAQFKYYGCHFEQNGYEGIKNSVSTLSGLLLDACWFESNNTASAHASGYYNVLLDNANNANNAIQNCYFNGATTADNGHIAFEGVLYTARNIYIAPSKTASVTFLGVNDTLYSDYDSLYLNNGNVSFLHVNNAFITTRHDVLDYSSNYLLGAGHNNVPRLSNVTITNAGATDSIIFNLPSVNNTVGPITFAAVTAHKIRLSPASGDCIIYYSNGVDLDIYSNGTLGCAATLVGISNTYWQEFAIVGTWSSE